MMTIGFIKLMRSEKAKDLCNYPYATALLFYIALHAQRQQHSPIGLKNLGPGQAYVGKISASCGLTETQYRTAKKQLSRFGLASFQGTNKGTIATLLNSDIYDINLGTSNEPATTQVTDKARPRRDIDAPNKNIRNKEKKKKEKALPTIAVELAELLLAEIRENHPTFKQPDINGWADAIDKAIRLDGRTPDVIRKMILWCQDDSFWRAQILSGAKLRKQFDQLFLKMDASDYAPLGLSQLAQQRKADMDTVAALEGY